MKEDSILEFHQVSFRYPGAEKDALCDLSVSVRRSEFLVVAGESGCGKSTLLSHMKKNHIPFGKGSGSMTYISGWGDRIEIEEMEDLESVSKIGFVGQDTDGQVVSDKVWHELSFGLENLGTPNDVMRRRTAEIAEFLGIKEIYEKNVSEISGGERQLVVLASVMAMNPEILILDEPINQLSPRAAREFMNVLRQINRELSTTIILSEQRLSSVFPYADRVLVMEAGRMIDILPPSQLGGLFETYKKEHGKNLAIFGAIPAASRIFLETAKNKEEGMPVSVREGRSWLQKEGPRIFAQQKKQEEVKKERLALEARELSFSYEKDVKVLKKLNLKVYEKSFLAIMGGNGSGKTTLLKCLAGILKPKVGKVKAVGNVAYLPQNPRSLFTEINAEEELAEVFVSYGTGESLKQEEIIKRVNQMLSDLELEDCRKQHPYDLSGGQAQRLALGKILLTDPNILLLDEPTKGLDAARKKTLAELLGRLQAQGKTIVMVSHDMEFAAEYASHCAFMFQGDIVTAAKKRSFFLENLFFTTETAIMTKGILPDCITVEDAVSAILGGAYE